MPVMGRRDEGGPPDRRWARAAQDCCVTSRRQHGPGARPRKRVIIEINFDHLVMVAMRQTQEGCLAAARGTGNKRSAMTGVLHRAPQARTLPGLGLFS